MNRSVNLDDLPLPVLNSIAEHLSRDDIIHTSMSSKALTSLYPRRITHVFDRHATRSDYDYFLRALQHKNIETLDVFVDPEIWSDLASSRLKDWSCDTVKLMPLHPKMMGTPCWFPECRDRISGFFSEDDPDHLFLRTEPMTLGITYTNKCTLECPEIHPRVKKLNIEGLFSHLHRIPLSVEHIVLSDIHFCKKDWKHMENFQRVNMNRCTFDADCDKIVLNNVGDNEMFITLDILPYVKDIISDSVAFLFDDENENAVYDDMHTKYTNPTACYFMMTRYSQERVDLMASLFPNATFSYTVEQQQNPDDDMYM